MLVGHVCWSKLEGTGRYWHTRSWKTAICACSVWFQPRLLSSSLKGKEDFMGRFLVGWNGENLWLSLQTLINRRLRSGKDVRIVQILRGRLQLDVHLNDRWVYLSSIVEFALYSSEQGIVPVGWSFLFCRDRFQDPHYRTWRQKDKTSNLVRKLACFRSHID